MKSDTRYDPTRITLLQIDPQVKPISRKLLKDSSTGQGGIIAKVETTKLVNADGKSCWFQWGHSFS